MSEPLALIVDDEPDIRELLEITLGRMGVKTTAVEDLGRARTTVARGHFDLCLTDMRLPDGNGIELVRFIQERCPTVPVAVITAHGNMESAVEALKAGAFDFVSKPVDLQALRSLVNTALKLRLRPDEPRRKLVGDSAPLRALRETIGKLARSQAPVYISGESGTGKELVARMIHEQGPRADQPFVPVNCGAIPEELMESEFFGHKKGSFTGAIADKPGLFQTAAGGTLFLDEVADLPLPMQVKLLRAIQEKTIRPVGAQQETPTDVRLLSATHEDLVGLVASGRFRQDLYYRVNVIEVRVPPLRDRRDDVPRLAAYIVDRISRQNGEDAPAISDDALALLQRYPFPGNIRELENTLERAVAMCEGRTIEPGDLGIASTDTLPSALDAALENIERDRIFTALEQTGGNKPAAAKLLGISFPALRYRLQKFERGKR